MILLFGSTGLLGSEIAAELKKNREPFVASCSKEVDLTNQAVEIYKQLKVRRRGVARPPLKELGVDPETNLPTIIKDGRFRMYLTDGETNATFRRGDTVEVLTIERTVELIAGRRAWEIENFGESKKFKRAMKSAPTFTEKTIKGGAGSQRKAKKSSNGKSRNSK